MDPNTIIKISRDGVVIGEFKAHEIAASLQSGDILPNDYCWHNGMSEWKQVSEKIFLKNGSYLHEGIKEWKKIPKVSSGTKISDLKSFFSQVKHVLLVFKSFLEKYTGKFGSLRFLIVIFIIIMAFVALVLPLIIPRTAAPISDNEFKQQNPEAYRAIEQFQRGLRQELEDQK
jgi:hypothetical protein